MEIYGIAFWITYLMLLGVVWQAYLSKIYRRLKHAGMYLSYHNLVTGAHIDRVWNEGVNIIDGKPRMYAADKVFKGTLYYDGDNVEPCEIERVIREGGVLKYTYYCNSKNFDTVNRNDLLETLMILKTENKIILVIFIAIALIVLGVMANYYFVSSTHIDIITHIDALKQTNVTGLKLGN